MKGGHRHPPAGAAKPAPLSPTSKTTAKYTNKDGSKFITVPKGSTPVESSHPSPTAAPASATPPAATAASSNGPPQQPVNRKKQKRRAKAAAKAAAEQALGGQPPNGLPSPPASHEQHSGDADADYSHDDLEDDVREAELSYQGQNGGYTQGESAKGKKTKKKKKKAAGSSADEPHDGHQHHAPPGQIVAPPASRALDDHHNRSGMSREKIWNTSSQEERERIKEFWLGLSESERKSLVKVEKDAVLKKMKEQQKHTCSCTVCGRKRTAIEEELEGLYDAYYEELEQYANHPNQGDGPPMLRPNQSYGPPGGARPRGLAYSNHQPSHGRIVEHVGDDEEEDEEDDYSDDELEDEEYSDEEPSEEHRSDYAADFFNFGNSLTVQGRDRPPILPMFLQRDPLSGTGNNAYGSSSLGGILTVADDLLKNDGKKFIEMMEQLAERRMAREEDVREQFGRGHNHANGEAYGDHYPEEEEFDEEEEYEEDDEEDYDSGEEEETMTEEQRMEEGRRMFQIFAARMFEQRVLTAYREKVAKERQAKLIEEIEDESRQESQRKAKKAKEAQKRKDKAAKKKEALAEEKARREAEKAAEDAARLAEEARKAEEQRAKAEEKRKKREAQKKAEEEERLRKEAERQRRIHEREESERKAREAREREKKAREEARLKEKETREQKEREARERREQQERDKREKDAKAKANREARDAKETKEAKEREKLKQEERAAQKAAALAAAVPVPLTLPKRPAQHQGPAAVPAVPQQASASFASPQISVATPALPKAPTPMRARQTSHQENPTSSSSQQGSGPGQNPSPHPITPIRTSPGPIGPPGRLNQTGLGSQGGMQPQSHPASPLGMPSKSLPPQPSPFGMPPMGMPFPPGLPPQNIPPGFGSPMHRDPMFAPQMPPQMFRPAPGLGHGVPPGFGGRGFSVHPPPGFQGLLDSPVAGLAQGFGVTVHKDSSQSHSRQGSGSFDPGTPVAASQPISRPTPIGRPASIVQGQRPQSGSPSSGLVRPELDAQLGSSALLDDDLDDTFLDYSARPPRGMSLSNAPGPRPIPPFPMSPFAMDPLFGQHHSNPWGPSSAPQPSFFAPQPPGFPAWGPPQMNPTFGTQAQPIEPRYVVLRKHLCRVCEDLDAAARDADGGSGAYDGFVPLDDIKARFGLLQGGGVVDEKELLEICETEGNHQNGGGSFDMRDDGSGRKFIRFDVSGGRTNPRPIQRAVGAPGEIGSPIVGSRSMGSGGR
ncbi:salt tolerance down-regulator-domain-containing protein [Cercophora newfieldiana]|uniref:Stress response protein NST1 n=1 Tax=Cercophora newfieldiana TaxID=92897 RepID=A0AA39XY49_9PEZI|nr:salt tolerance down-regulator-domain-containing protein [Cercophora newfieldiana]